MRDGKVFARATLNCDTAAGDFKSGGWPLLGFRWVTVAICDACASENLGVQGQSVPSPVQPFLR